MTPDVTIVGGGTLYLFQLHTSDAQEWVEQHVSGDCLMLGDGLAVEHRFAGALAEGMIADGLIVDAGW